jgi:hypothetical protein
LGPFKPSCCARFTAYFCKQKNYIILQFVFFQCTEKCDIASVHFAWKEPFHFRVLWQWCTGIFTIFYLDIIHCVTWITPSIKIRDVQKLVLSLSLHNN